MEADMKRTLAAIAGLVRDEHGQDLLEYALLATVIAVAAIVAVTTVGSTINSVFWTTIAASVAAAV
jgi:Flp pilus assembly pilin Flp